MVIRYKYAMHIHISMGVMMSFTSTSLLFKDSDLSYSDFMLNPGRIWGLKLKVSSLQVASEIKD